MLRRRQSTVILLENKRKVNPKESFESNGGSNSNGHSDQSILTSTNNYLGLHSAPNPLDKPPIRKVSTLLPVEEMKTILGSTINTKKTIPRRTTGISTNEKAKIASQNINPFQGLKISASKASNLVETILTEDHRWTNVPDNYQDYKPEDFILKLDTNKLEVIFYSSSSSSSLFLIF